VKALAFVCVLALAGCSREGSSEAVPAPSRPSEPPSAPSSAEAPLASAGPVLTPEDVEAETEHRITEENLERELDRLEREIQAE
jgi:hypothetical protein